MFKQLGVLNPVISPLGYAQVINSEPSSPFRYWMDPVLTSLSVSQESKVVEVNRLEVNASTELASRTDVERVMSIYVIQDSAGVRAYLAKYPFLVALLIDASFAIDKRFPGVASELHVISDPEIPKYECLTAMILAPGSFRETKAAAESFERGWWFDAMDRARGKLSIDLI
jgi:hypothetical protein